MADGIVANKQFRNVIYHPIEIELGIVLSIVIVRLQSVIKLGIRAFRSNLQRKPVAETIEYD